jgi:hypothetical protein
MSISRCTTFDFLFSMLNCLQVHCFCTACQFLQTIAPCIAANCSAADQQTTDVTAQAICNAATPPVQLPPLGSLLNATGSAACAPASSSVSGASASASASVSAKVSANATTTAGGAATSSAATGSSHSGASGRIEGDMRIMMAVGAMAGVVAVAFFAV